MAIRFHNHFRGLQLTFPVRLLSREFVRKQLKCEFNGCNLKELSRKYDYSERWIRKIIEEIKSNIDHYE